MKTLCWVLGLLLCGCQSVHYETDKGYVSSSLTINRWGTEPLEAMIGAAHIATEDVLVGPFNYDLGAGPVVVVPTDGKGMALGIDTSVKFLYTTFPVQPYLELGAGFLDAPERWEGQGTNWGFILQGGLGLRYAITKDSKLGISYKQWHESNGAAIFGSPGPNPGFEGGSLWLSYAFEF